MKGRFRSLAAFLLGATVVLSTILPVWGADASRTDQALVQTAAYVSQAVPTPQVSSTGGEWAVMALARCGRLSQASRDSYLSTLAQTLEQQEGVLSTRKYSEYARVVLALSALGEDPRNVAGYDLIAPLLDGDQMEKQGINGPIFALLALNSGTYGEEDAKERYLQAILQAQLPDGGWSLAGSTADPDVTAQALQALAPYAGQDGPAAQSVQRGLSCLAQLWEEDSFLTSESCAQAVIAYAALDSTPPQDLMEELLSYQQADGSFAHMPGGKSDLMASEQALCALVALARQERGLAPFYDMTFSGTEQADPALLTTLFTAQKAVSAPHPFAQAG